MIAGVFAWLGVASLLALFSAPGPALATPSESLAAGVEAVVADAGKRPDAERLHRLFQIRTDYVMQEFPEYATYVGVRGQNDRWTDHAPDAIARRKAALELPAKALASIDRAALSPADRLNYDLFRRQIEERLAGRRFPWELMPVNQLGGIQQSVPQMLGEQMPASTEADYEAILSRLRGTPVLVDQTIALMKEGLRRGITPPKITLRDVAAQAGAILIEDPARSPFLAAFRSMPASIPANRRDALKADAATLLTAQVVPAFRRFRDFLATEYVPHCRESLAATALPDGQAWYAYAVASSTTTRLTPKQIHEIGLDEVRTIRAEMERVVRSTGFDRDLAAFFVFVRSDLAVFLLPAGRPPGRLSRDRQARRPRSDQALRPPPAPALRCDRDARGLRRVPDRRRLRGGIAGRGPARLFLRESLRREHAPEVGDGSPGAPRVRARASSADRAGPGADGSSRVSADTAGTTPSVKAGGSTRRRSATTWASTRIRTRTSARSTIRCGARSGSSSTPACMPSAGAGEQAIDYFKANSAKSEQEIVVEIDRYVVSPGQALSYKIGQRKFLELRARAARELGTRFDLRLFHDAVLADGALPLDMLDARIDEWIAQRKAQATRN